MASGARASIAVKEEAVSKTTAQRAPARRESEKTAMRRRLLREEPGRESLDEQLEIMDGCGAGGSSSMNRDVTSRRLSSRNPRARFQGTLYGERSINTVLEKADAQASGLPAGPKGPVEEVGKRMTKKFPRQRSEVACDVKGKRIGQDEDCEMESNSNDQSRAGWPDLAALTENKRRNLAPRNEDEGEGGEGEERRTQGKNKRGRKGRKSGRGKREKRLETQGTVYGGTADPNLAEDSHPYDAELSSDDGEIVLNPETSEENITTIASQASLRPNTGPTTTSQASLPAYTESVATDQTLLPAMAGDQELDEGNDRSSQSGRNSVESFMESVDTTITLPSPGVPEPESEPESDTEVAQPDEEPEPVVQYYTPVSRWPLPNSNSVAGDGRDESSEESEGGRRRSV